MIKDKVALVTGASTGIGRAIALAYAREGARVVVSDVAALDDTVALVEGAGGQVLAVRADVSRAADCEALVAAAVQAFGAWMWPATTPALPGRWRRRQTTRSTPGSR